MPRTLVCPSRKSVVISIFAFIPDHSGRRSSGANPQPHHAEDRGTPNRWWFQCRIPWARAEFDQGRVEGSLNISHAAIVFRLAPSQQADLDKLLAEQQDPRLGKLSQMADSGAVRGALWHERRRPRASDFVAEIARPDRGRLLPRPHPRLFQRDRGPGGKCLPHRTAPLPGERTDRVWRMLPRFPCRRRFPAWCWASAGWKLSAPCPGRAWPGRTSLRTRPGTTSWRPVTLPRSTT